MIRTVDRKTLSVDRSSLTEQRTTHSAGIREFNDVRDDIKTKELL